MILQLFTEFIHSLTAQLGAWEKFEAGTGVMTYFYQAFQRLFIEVRESLTLTSQILILNETPLRRRHVT